MATYDPLFLLPIADTTIMIITQLICAENVITPAAQSSSTPSQCMVTFRR